MDLLSTYIKRFDVLESKIDTSVDMLLTDLEEKLLDAGFNKSEAIGIANEYLKIYEESKEARREDLNTKFKAVV